MKNVAERFYIWFGVLYLVLAPGLLLVGGLMWLLTGSVPSWVVYVVGGGIVAGFISFIFYVVSREAKLDRERYGLPSIGGPLALAFFAGVIALAMPARSEALLDCPELGGECAVCSVDSNGMYRCRPSSETVSEPVCEDTSFAACIMAYGDRLCIHAKKACRAEVREHNAKCQALKEKAHKRGKARVRRTADSPKNTGEAALPSRREVEEHQFNRWWKCHQLIYENDPDCRP